MTRAIALARTVSATTDAVEIFRIALVCACAMALVAAGPALPF